MNVIFVTGPPRSGTSLTASIIETCGSFGGESHKGFYENIRIKNKVLKPLLKNNGIDPMGQHPLGDVSECENLSKKIYSQVIDCWIEDGWDQKSPVYFKDAKLLLCWRIWAQAFPKARWVVTDRDPQQIAQSCMRASFMLSHNSIEEWKSFAKEYQYRANDLTKKISAHQINPRVCGDFRPLVESLGMIWNDTAATISRLNLWHN